MRAVTVSVKKNTQSKTVGYKTLPISDIRVKSIYYFRPQEVKLKTKPFGPELPPEIFMYGRRH